MAVSLLQDWQGPDRYGDDLLLFKFDWRDEQVLRWIEKFPQIGLQNTRENIKRLDLISEGKHAGTLLRSLAWKTWAISGGDAQVFEARYAYYAKFAELAVGRGEPFNQLPPNIPHPKWGPITMPDGRRRKAKPHVVTELRSQARKFSTMLRRHFSFVGLTYMAYAMGDNQAAADTVNRMLLDNETNVRAFEGR